jgi:hypothetical protein
MKNFREKVNCPQMNTDKHKLKQEIENKETKIID